MDPDELERRLAATRRRIEAELQARLGLTPLPGELARPERLFAAMRHGSLNGGKRLRPFLLLEAAGLFAPSDGVVEAAVALECLHCYSLIHDDLPAMDNDGLRRGRPTVHVAYDEASAILAGDALLSLAFELTAGSHPLLGARLVVLLARAGGAGGMIGGQMLDLAAEGRFGDGRPLRLSEGEIRRLQAMKTGALIRYAAEAGALLGGAGADDVERLARYGEIIGLAFQLADDLLDATGDATVVGKATAKDAAVGKGTLVALHGVEAARASLSGLVVRAEETLAPFGSRAAPLVALARYVAERDR